MLETLNLTPFGARARIRRTRRPARALVGA
jgi:hypothetical protein